MQTSNPYQPPRAAVDTGAQSTEQTEKIRTGQKLILYAILLNLLTVAVRVTEPMLGLLPGLIALIMSLVGVVRLGSGLGMSVPVRVLLVILMFLPLINLITLLVINSKATAALRAAGYRVGLMGASGK